MSSDILTKGVYSAILSLVLAYVVFSQYRNERRSENESGARQRYIPAIPGIILPAFILLLSALACVFLGVLPAAQMALSACFTIFLHICLYYAVLLIFLPVLRKHVRAETCALLWLVPNFLYLIEMDYMAVPRPVFVIRTSGNWVWALFGMWFAGAVAVLLWKIASHLWFRKQILKDAHPAAAETQDLWRQVMREGRIKRPVYPLVISPWASSPLTIGLFHRSQKVVLPDRPYSSDELWLIFRHEMIHIGREDSWSKFFLMFCTAMCWFNPLMWVAMRKSADDLELSCDEAALLDADEKTRRQYAGLLLSSAGDQRGFTTCLSAGAEALRYRLKAAMTPRRRHSGAVLAGVLCFALFMTCGYVALAYGENTGEELLFHNQDHSRFQLQSITVKYGEAYAESFCTDEDALDEYLAELKMDHLTGNYSFSEEERDITYIYDTPEGTMVVSLSEHRIAMVPLYGEDAAEYCEYYLPEPVDWDFLDGIMTRNPYA